MNHKRLSNEESLNVSDVFSHESFADHEMVVHVRDADSGLRALIAVHDTSAGPAIGGIRRFAYDDESAALNDVLRLSRAMTYKTATAGLDFGGGKSVILAEPGQTVTEAQLRAFARGIERLGGSYFGGEDVGIGVAQIDVMAKTTDFVLGRSRGPFASGDPSPFTAEGVDLGLRAAVGAAFGSDSVADLTIGIIGLGAVGMKLAERLRAAGATLIVTDIDERKTGYARRVLEAEVIDLDGMLGRRLDVLAPCALGGLLTEALAERIDTRVIAGAANNQLANDAAGDILHERGILYAPDYVINAGGLLNVAAEAQAMLAARAGRNTRYEASAVHDAVARIPATLRHIFARAQAEHCSPAAVADALAEERLSHLKHEPLLVHAAE